MYDPEFHFTRPDDERDLDALDFEDQDRIEAQEAEDYRALTTGLPARPGTRR